MSNTTLPETPPRHLPHEIIDILQKAGCSTLVDDHLSYDIVCIWPSGDFVLGICAGFQLEVVAAELVLEDLSSGVFARVGRT